MTYRQIIGNLLDSKEKYIVHQTNCVSRGSAAGLARILFNAYPYADCYIDRKQNSLSGTIDIRGNGKDQRYVVNLMGQYNPGGSDLHSKTDTPQLRENYFIRGLLRLLDVENLESVAFPAGIGCAIAGGNWKNYLNYINDFYIAASRQQKIDVSVYCLPMNVEEFKFIEKEY